MRKAMAASEPWETETRAVSGSVLSMEDTTRKEGNQPITAASAAVAEEDFEPMWQCGEEKTWPSKGCGGVMLQGYGAGGEEQGRGGLARTKKLTEDDLEELKGCFDLGFGFSYEEIPDLCNTLPALELCYSMSRASHRDGRRHDSCPENSLPLSNWKIFAPGDDPDEVKARLKYWAQAVAFTVRLCS